MVCLLKIYLCMNTHFHAGWPILLFVLVLVSASMKSKWSAALYLLWSLHLNLFPVGSSIVDCTQMTLHYSDIHLHFGLPPMTHEDIVVAIDDFSMSKVKAFSQDDRDSLLTTMEAAANGAHAVVEDPPGHGGCDHGRR